MAKNLITQFFIRDLAKIYFALNRRNRNRVVPNTIEHSLYTRNATYEITYEYNSKSIWEPTQESPFRIKRPRYNFILAFGSVDEPLEKLCWYVSWSIEEIYLDADSSCTHNRWHYDDHQLEAYKKFNTNYRQTKINTYKFKDAQGKMIEPNWAERIIGELQNCIDTAIEFDSKFNKCTMIRDIIIIQNKLRQMGST